MGLDKQPTSPPKRVREARGGDGNISLKAPSKVQKAVNGDGALLETSHPEDAETPVREKTTDAMGKARDGEGRTQLTTAENCCRAVILHVSLHRL